MPYCENDWKIDFNEECITLDTVKNHQKNMVRSVQEHILKLVVDNLKYVLQVSEDKSKYSIFATKSIFSKEEFKLMSKLAVKELKKRKFKVKLIFNNDYNEIQIYGW